MLSDFIPLAQGALLKAFSFFRMHWPRAKPHPLFSSFVSLFVLDSISSDESDSNYFMTSSLSLSPFSFIPRFQNHIQRPCNYSLRAFMNLVIIMDLVKHFSLTVLCLVWRRSHAAASFACITMHVLHTEPKQSSLGCESSLAQSGSRSSSADFFTVPS